MGKKLKSEQVAAESERKTKKRNKIKFMCGL